MSEPQQSLTGPPAGEPVERGLLDQILEDGKLGRGPASRERGKDLLKQFIDQVSQGSMTVSEDTELMINRRIDQIDQLLSKQLNEILHNEKFQKLEASWRGLRYLLAQSETGTMLKIRVLNATKKELFRDFAKASEFDQSALFKKVYEDEFGVFGGEPFAAIVGDYEFGRAPEEIDLLERISQVAAAAHAPFLTAAAPDLINLDSFTKLGSIRDIAKTYDNTEFVKWKSFRASEDSRYVGLCLPHVLMRLPYGKDNTSVEAFQYEEAVDGREHSKYLWGNAAYALGARLSNAFSMYGWAARIRGVESGGLVEGLPTHTFHTDEGDVALKCPTEIAITDRREKELADQGFISLVHCKGTDYAAFFSAQSAQKPKLYDKDAATASARMSAQLPYMLAVSRFAHYLKSIMRDKIGKEMSRGDTERWLNEWITNYVTEDDNAIDSWKASHPLRAARIEVAEVAGKPGAYRAVAFLKPHFQLDELAVSLRLVADLPPSARS
ncbi:MAG: type VI secretion system contractile sheath large subunit [Acidobacteriota bacterium]|nr:type VI secretion system contractile sheath large subunit [Acidobacteriota bacterium]